jgi:pimeloyl-ACP methyl ester carboxylesterase
MTTGSECHCWFPYPGERAMPDYFDDDENKVKGFRQQELVVGTEDEKGIAKKLADVAKVELFEPGFALYNRNDDADSVRFVLSGSLKLLDDDYKLIAVVEAGKSIGESPLADPRRKYTVTAIAREPSHIARVSYGAFLEIAKGNAEIWNRLFVKVTQRLNMRLYEDATRERLVILVHGILTFADWQSKVGTVLKKAKLNVAETNFGLLDLITFLLPVKYFRRKRIDKVLRQLRHARIESPNAKISILAHSFGTYIVAEILASEPDITVHRVVFCGSIVPFDHPFVNEIGRRVTDRVVNDVGSRDIWPAFANSVTTGYGDTGTYGFRHPKVTDRWFTGYAHSDFLTPEFCEKYWVPFFKDGKKGLDEIDEKHPDKTKKEDSTGADEPLPFWRRCWLAVLAVFKKNESLPFWVYWLAIFKIKYVVLFLAATAIWWNWNDLTNIFASAFFLRRMSAIDP